MRCARRSRRDQVVRAGLLQAGLVITALWWIR
jgi:hypothetical protein